MSRRSGMLCVAATVALLSWAPSSARPHVSADDSPRWIQTGSDSVVGADAVGAQRQARTAVALAGAGFNAYGTPNFGDYTIVLVTSAEGNIEDYRDEFEVMADQVNARNGLSIRVAPGTIAGPADPIDLDPPEGQIWATISSTSPCAGSAWAGCGGPGGNRVIDGVAHYTYGALWLHTTRLAPAGPVAKQAVVSHEIGHTLGLTHFDTIFEGQYQVMRSFLDGTYSALQSGDLNGIAHVVDTPPSNDDVSAATPVGPGDATVSASTWFATAQPDEPVHAGAGPRRSVWYRYTPGADQGGGTATIRTLNDGTDDFDTVLGVYRGTMFSAVVPVASNNDVSGQNSQVSFTVDTAQTYWIAVDGSDFARGETEVAFDLPPTVFGSPLLALPPARLMETRIGAAPTIDGQFWQQGARVAGSVTELTVAGRGGVAADASAVALNVTITGPVAAGYVTVFPCGSSQPNASSLNFVAGQTISNAVIVQVGTNGSVCLFTLAGTHMVVDVNGYSPSLSSFRALSPTRLMETRVGEPTTADGQFWQQGMLPAGSVSQLTVTGRGGVPGDASAVALNVTVTGPQAAGYVTVFPCGSAQPTASNLNYQSGQTIPNAVIARVGVGGAVCLFASAASHLVVDVGGYFTAGSLFSSLVPARLLETRVGEVTTIDGQFWQHGIRAAGSVTQLTVAGRGGVPGDASAVALNVTVTNPQAAGYIIVYPCGSPQPTASNVNYQPGQTIANAAVTRVGVGGKVCLFTLVPTHLVVDVNGSFPA